ncbi:cytoskeleton associated protein, putative [Plasmodium malariae]|uniref:Cytoskeleton associated protein, putative n=1 Tax=Plasmodium malariae TaxID=5858 RepID=A0A1A8VNW9_PLAMA|nr:cytoskeleton associated protein, putative [Plasmodium malariae]
MEGLFNNKKELFIGKRVFSCNFTKNKIDKEEKENSILGKVSEQHYAHVQDKLKGNDNERKEESTSDEVVDKNLKIYLFNEDIKIKIGTVRYIGPLKNHPDTNKIFYGIEWDNKFDGKHFGNYKGEFYFSPLLHIKKDKTKRHYYDQLSEGLANFHDDADSRDNTTGKVSSSRVQKSGIGNSSSNSRSNSSSNSSSNSRSSRRSNSRSSRRSNSRSSRRSTKRSNSHNCSDSGEKLRLWSGNSGCTPCSFVPIENIHVGITFMQALNFRYNYFTDLDLSIQDYQTKKMKTVIFSGEEKARNYFKNFCKLKNITLNKCLIYTYGFKNNLCFSNLESLSLCCNLFSKWNDIFKIIKISKNLTYLNVSENKFTKLDLNCVLAKVIWSEGEDEHAVGYNHEDDVVYFEQIKELCLDNTLIDWDDVLALSFIFPNLETLSIKKNYITSIKIKNIRVTKNSIIFKYITNKKYKELFHSYEKDNLYEDLEHSRGIQPEAQPSSTTPSGRIKNEYVLPSSNGCTYDRREGFLLERKKSAVLSVQEREREREREREPEPEPEREYGIGEEVVGGKDEEENISQIKEKRVLEGTPQKYYLKINANPSTGTTESKGLSSDRITGVDQDVFLVDMKEEALLVDVNPFRHLKKIVLNDNYLHDYEELFYFVHRIKTVQSLFINNNKFSDNSNLINIAYTICLEEKNKTELAKLDNFDLINRNFKHIKEFLFDNNEVKNYETLRDLFYILYNIEILKIQNKKKNFSEKKSLRYIYISVMPQLKVLNHSSISKNERINSERFFISLYHKDNIAKIFNEQVLNRRHSTRLEQIHYKAMQDQTNTETSKSMQSNLINITIIPEFLNAQKFDIIKKKVNRNMNIKDLKFLCSRLYSVPLPKLQLFYTDENNPMCIEIVDTNSSLYTYGIENNSKIKIKMEE